MSMIGMVPQLYQYPIRLFVSDELPVVDEEVELDELLLLEELELLELDELLLEELELDELLLDDELEQVPTGVHSEATVGFHPAWEVLACRHLYSEPL